LGFYLEYATGIEPLWMVAGELDAYAGGTGGRSAYAAPTAAILHGMILFWFPSARREANVRKTLRGRNCPVPVATAARDYGDPDRAPTTRAPGSDPGYPGDGSYPDEDYPGEEGFPGDGGPFARGRSRPVTRAPRGTSWDDRAPGDPRRGRLPRAAAVRGGDRTAAGDAW
jgi:hypothetical protein